MLDCSNITLAGITQDCSTSAGGIKRVFLTQYSKVTDVALDEAGKQIATVTLDPGAKWYEYEFRRNTGSLTSNLTVDETAGINYVVNELSLVFSKMETAKRIEIASISTGHMRAVVEDSNGKFWFLGKDDYVSASAGGGNTGTAKGDQNAYTVTLKSEELSYPYELTPEAAAAVIESAASQIA